MNHQISSDEFHRRMLVMSQLRNLCISLNKAARTAAQTGGFRLTCQRPDADTCDETTSASDDGRDNSGR
ncbi:MAG: hypothetical protein NTY46_11825 [Candidatus Sumerlaeota bacterium]|nr:hypothetical protein [Candidatus Sumerlaeota bacterium]